MTVLFLYGGYSLWDTWRIYHGALADQDLMELKPVKGEDSESVLTGSAKDQCRCLCMADDYDTGIDYPVVRGKMIWNISTKMYMETLLCQELSFLQSANQPDFTDPYNLIYGHHMSNGAMFGDVVEFADEEYFTAHETGTLYLPEETRSITIFACVETGATDSRSMDISQNRTRPGRCSNFCRM